MLPRRKARSVCRRACWRYRRRRRRSARAASRRRGSPRRASSRARRRCPRSRAAGRAEAAPAAPADQVLVGLRASGLGFMGFMMEQDVSGHRPERFLIPSEMCTPTTIRTLSRASRRAVTPLASGCTSSLHPVCLTHNVLRPAGGSKGKPRGIMGKHGVMKYFTTPLAGAMACRCMAAFVPVA